MCACVGSKPHTTDVYGTWEPNDREDVFQKSFLHHVITRPFLTHFKTPEGDLTSEKVTHMFHNNFYSVELLAGYQGDRKIDLDRFFESLIENPINIDTETKERLGPNKIVAIIGRVGTGKSTFLSHLLVRNHQKIKKENIFALRVDVEQFAGRDVRKGLFFKNLFHTLQSETFARNASDTPYWKEQFLFLTPEIEANDDDNMALQYILAIRSLFITLRERYGLRGMLFLDNLDKYYYLFDRACFSKEGEIMRADGMGKLSSILREFEAPAGQLDGAGLCVLIALRRHTLDYLTVASHVAPNNALNLDEIAGESVFRLAPKSPLQVVDARIKLIRKIGQITFSKHSVNNALEHLSQIEKLWRASADPTFGIGQKNHSKRSSMIEDLGRFMQHGHRSLIDHLGKYRWAMSDTVAFRRIFNTYHPAILLFMLRNKQRYSQVECRFPNLFLVRGEMSGDGVHGFPERLQSPHKHTYWLKYLIMCYIHSRNLSGKSVRPQDIKDVFCRGEESDGYYEQHIVELVLGSLSQVDGSFCLETHYGTSLTGNGVEISNVNLTPRGEFLIERFAFDFTYLQLIVEDFMLELPCSPNLEGWRREFQIPDTINYNYLVDIWDNYVNAAGTMISLKVRLVAMFLEVLRASLKAEMIRHAPVFEHYEMRGGKLPEFDKIESEIIRAVESVLSHLTSYEAQISPVQAFSSAKQDREKLEEFFRDAYCIKNI